MCAPVCDPDEPSEMSVGNDPPDLLAVLPPSDDDHDDADHPNAQPGARNKIFTGGQKRTR